MTEQAAREDLTDGAEVEVPETAEVGNGLVRIDLSGGDLHRKVDAAWDAVIAANDAEEPRVLVRGNEIVRMTERGELEPFSSISLRDELSRVAEFGRFNAGGEWVPRDPPRDIADALRERDSQDYPHAPKVDRVVDVPVVAANGSLVTRPGYHHDSHIYYRPSPDLADLRSAITAVDEVDDLEAARELLLGELLGDFAFADESSRANALGLLLLPFVREFIGDGPTPLHAIIAPEPGTGKTLLAQAALMPGCGLVPVTAGDRDHNDEWRKSLTAALLSGTRAIVLDNLRTSVDSGPLAAAITTGVWRDRVLGHSKNVTLPVRNAWVATGNNLDLSDEQARRTVPIFLDPGDVRPADRPKEAFSHPDLLRWTRRNRARLVEAALTLVQHWLDGPAELVRPGAGTLIRHSELYDEEPSPRPGTATLGSFERWAEVVGGILEAANVTGFLGNRDRLYAEANEEGREAVAFLAAWHALGREAIEFSELMRLCGFGGELHDDLPTEMLTVRSDKRNEKLAPWLQQHRDRRHGPYQLVREEGSGHGGRKRWLVVRRDGG